MSEVQSPTDLMPSDRWAQSADIVEKILRGKKPTHIPIEEPTKFALVVNLNTAKAFG
jgi:putative ABC transport system substrate-binding protein